MAQETAVARRMWLEELNATGDEPTALDGGDERRPRSGLEDERGADGAPGSKEQAVRAEVDVRASEADMSQLAVDWFETAAEGIFGPLLRSLRNGPELRIPGRGESVVGSPGSLWASLTEQDPLWGRVRSRKPWSGANWSRFLARAAKRPADSEFWILELNEEGRRYGASHEDPA